MGTGGTTPEKIHQKIAWILLLVLVCLFSLGALGAVIQGTNPAAFQNDTGILWSEFSDAYPTVATLVVLLDRLLGAAMLGLGLCLIAILFFRYRKGARWAWYTMWIFPGVLALIAILMYLHDQGYVGVYYVGGTAIAVLGLVLPVGQFFPGANS